MVAFPFLNDALDSSSEGVKTHATMETSQALDWLIDAARENVLRGPEPAYFRIAEFLRARIKAGVFDIGAKIPTEVELMQAFGVGRQTVRNAIQVLTSDALLEKRAGLGTFVLSQQEPARGWTISSVKTFSEQNYPGISKVEKIEWLDEVSGIKLPDSGCWSTAPVLCVEINRYLGGARIAHTKAYLPADIGKKIFTSLKTGAHRKGAILKLLNEKCRIEIHVVQQISSAFPASDHIAQKLDVALGSPIFLLRHTFYDAGKNIIEISHIYSRYDAYENIVEIRV